MSISQRILQFSSAAQMYEPHAGGLQCFLVLFMFSQLLMFKIDYDVIQDYKLLAPLRNPHSVVLILPCRQPLQQLHVAAPDSRRDGSPRRGTFPSPGAEQQAPLRQKLLLPQERHLHTVSSFSQLWSNITVDFLNAKIRSPFRLSKHIVVSIFPRVSISH